MRKKGQNPKENRRFFFFFFLNKVFVDKYLLLCFFVPSTIEEKREKGEGERRKIARRLGRKGKEREGEKKARRGQSARRLPSRRRRTQPARSGKRASGRAMQSLIELHIRRLVVSRIDKGGGFLSLKGGCSARSRMCLRPRSDLERAP